MCVIMIWGRRKRREEEEGIVDSLLVMVIEQVDSFDNRLRREEGEEKKSMTFRWRKKKTRDENRQVMRVGYDVVIYKNKLFTNFTSTDQWRQSGHGRSIVIAWYLFNRPTKNIFDSVDGTREREKKWNLIGDCLYKWEEDVLIIIDVYTLSRCPEGNHTHWVYVHKWGKEYNWSVNMFCCYSFLMNIRVCHEEKIRYRWERWCNFDWSIARTELFVSFSSLLMRIFVSVFELDHCSIRWKIKKSRSRLFPPFFLTI